METRRKEKLVWARGGERRKAVWREKWHLSWVGITGRGTQTQLSTEEVWQQEAVADFKHGPKASLSSPLEVAE